MYCSQPPYGDVDDRIRAIAHGLGLTTVLWKYDSNDWQVGANPNITTAYVDGQYEQMITDAGNGLFDTVRIIVLLGAPGPTRRLASGTNPFLTAH